MHDFVSSTQMILDALGWTVIHALWQGAIIATAIAVAFALLPREAAVIRYKLAYAGLVAMVIWSAFTFISEINGAYQLRVIYDNPVYSQSSYISVEGFHAIQVGWLGKMKNQLTDFIPWIAFLWLMGALFFSLRWLGGYTYIKGLRRTAQAIEAPFWQKKIDRIAAYFGLGKKISLMVSGQIQSPMVIGHLRPIILLPVGFLTALSPSQVEAILVHELAHIRRNDYLLNMLQQLLEVLFFYHPAYWWLNQVLQDEREHSCDDIAINFSGDPLAYARALTELEQHRLNHNKMAVGIQGRQNHMLGRIKRIMGIKQQNINMNTRLITFLITSMGLFGLAWMAPAHLPGISKISYAPDLTTIPLSAPQPEIRLRASQPALAPNSGAMIFSAEKDAPGFYLAGVDSPPPPPPPPPPPVHAPPPPPVHKNMPPPPPPPPVGMPPLPPTRNLQREGVPDYLNPEEAEALRQQDGGYYDSEEMKKFEKEMATWGKEFGETYGKQMEEYAKKMKKWQAEFEGNYSEEYTREMKKYAAEMAQWGAEFGEKFSSEYQKAYEKMNLEAERNAHLGDRDRDRARSYQDQAQMRKEVAIELAEKLRALEMMEWESMNEKEAEMRKLQQELRRVKEMMESEASEMRREQAESAREMERSQRDMERAMRTEEAQMRAEEARLQDQERRLRAEEQNMRERYETLRSELYKDDLIRSQKAKTHIQVDEKGIRVNGSQINKKLEQKYLRLLDLEKLPVDNRIDIRFD